MLCLLHRGIPICACSFPFFTHLLDSRKVQEGLFFRDVVSLLEIFLILFPYRCEDNLQVVETGLDCLYRGFAVC